MEIRYKEKKKTRARARLRTVPTSDRLDASRGQDHSSSLTPQTHTHIHMYIHTEAYLNFGSYRYRGSDIRAVLLSIPKPTPDTFRASGFGSADHTHYTLTLAGWVACATDSVVEVCRVNEEFEPARTRQKRDRSTHVRDA